MLKKYTLIDKQFGHIYVSLNPRARRITTSWKADGVHVTAPPTVGQDLIWKIVDDNRERIAKGLQRVAPKPIDLDYAIDAPHFKLRVKDNSIHPDKIYFTYQEGVVTLSCPPRTDFHHPALQERLRKGITVMMRRVGKLYLLPRLDELARVHGLTYAGGKISSSQGRWGSCSGRRHINLSCYLLLLPSHLIDYVILHELTHTEEMNHSQRFWKRLDELCGGQCEEWREEMKRYRPEI